MTGPYYVECRDGDDGGAAYCEWFGPFESRANALAELHFIQAGALTRCNNVHRVVFDIPHDARVRPPRTTERERVWQEARDAGARAAR